MVAFKNNLAWKDFYEKSATSHMPEHSRLLFGSLSEVLKQREFILKLIKKYFKKRYGLVFDVGCGTGRYLEKLSSLGWQTVGLDFSWAMIQEAKTHKHSVFSQSFGENLGVKSGQADLVLCIEMLQTSDNPNAVISEAYRILKPGGALILSTIRKISTYELCFLPLAIIIETDLSLKNAKWYYKLIKARDTLVWYDRPTLHPIKRYEVKCLYDMLKNNGFKCISGNYLGIINKIPWLLNSQSIIIIAKK